MIGSKVFTIYLTNSKMVVGVSCDRLRVCMCVCMHTYITKKTKTRKTILRGALVIRTDN
jgi:hypothetical protein